MARYAPVPYKLLERALIIIRHDLIRLAEELKAADAPRATIKDARDALANYTRILLAATKDLRDEERAAAIKMAGLTDAQLRMMAKQAGLTDAQVEAMTQ